MAIKYTKEVVKPDGRKLVAGGPRDQQRRLKEFKDQESFINILKDEIKQLRGNGLAATSQPVVDKDLFTGEQVDNEIRKAVAEALVTKELEFKIKFDNINKLFEDERSKNIKLKAESDSLEKLIDEKENTLKLERERNLQLMSQLSSSMNEESIYSDPDRPQIEKTFIDPLERDSGEHLRPHIESEKIKVEDKDKIYLNVDKLKGIMGKLPTK